MIATDITCAETTFPTGFALHGNMHCDMCAFKVL